MYIYENVVILPSMWYVLRFEHAHVLKRYNGRRMIRGQTTCSLRGTANGLILPCFILTIFIAVFPKTIAPSLDIDDIVKKMPLYIMVKNYSYVYPAATNCLPVRTFD